jgi:nucleoside-diphosphate-sugar epimerase
MQLNAIKYVNVFIAVFTSTVNVAFFGKEVIDGTEQDFESLDKSALDNYIDQYSKTKKMAENIVLGANGQNGILKSCVLRYSYIANALKYSVALDNLYRLSGIYGPTERALLRRTIDCITSGFFDHFGFIKESLKVDYLHIDNATQALIKVRRTENKSDIIKLICINIIRAWLPLMRRTLPVLASPFS